MCFLYIIIPHILRASPYVETDMPNIKVTNTKCIIKIQNLHNFSKHTAQTQEMFSHAKTILVLFHSICILASGCPFKAYIEYHIRGHVFLETLLKRVISQ